MADWYHNKPLKTPTQQFLVSVNTKFKAERLTPHGGDTKGAAGTNK
jgi:hypothetical protein